MSEGLPDDVAGLIDASIGSVTELEVLLAIAGADAGATPEMLAGILRISIEHVIQALSSLRETGLASAEDRSWRFAPASPEVDRCVAWLLDNHRIYRVAITTRIFSRPDDKLTGLAEGFRLRRPKRRPHG